MLYFTVKFVFRPDSTIGDNDAFIDRFIEEAIEAGGMLTQGGTDLNPGGEGRYFTYRNSNDWFAGTTEANVRFVREWCKRNKSHIAHYRVSGLKDDGEG